MSMGLPEELKKSISDQEGDLLRQGQRFKSFNKIRQREFYSTFLFAPGMGGIIPAGSYDLFKVIKGGTGQGYSAPLSERETNWPQANRVADNHNLVMKSFHCDIKRATSDVTVYPPAVLPAVPGTAVNGFVDLFVPPHAADVKAIATGMILGVTYLTNTVPIGYLSDFPSVGGVVGLNMATRQIAAAAAADPAESSTAAGAGQRPFYPITRNACNPAFERRPKVPTLLQHGEVFSMTLIVPTPIQLLGIGQTGANGESNDASGCVEVRVGMWATESFIERA